MIRGIAHSAREDRRLPLPTIILISRVKGRNMLINALGTVFISINLPFRQP